MSYHGEDRALNKSLKKQGRAMKRTGVLFIFAQVALSIGMFVLLQSTLGLLVGFALFTAAKWFIERIMAREYLVTEYLGKTIMNEYTTHGTALGGLLRLAGVFVLFVVLEAFVADYIFPDTSFFSQAAYRIGLLWVVGISILRDVTKIKAGNAIIAAAETQDAVSAFQEVEEIKAASENQEEDTRGKFSVACVALVVLLLVVQVVVCWIQGPGIAKKLDMHQAYETYYEKYDGTYKYGPIPLLTESWFEQVLQNKDAVKYSRFKTKCRVEGSGTMEQNGVPMEVDMELHYTYTETYGWRLAKAICHSAGVDFDSGDAATNISGTWYGVGRDKTMNNSSNNELTITLETLTATEVAGSISCARNGETYYTKTFRGTVEGSGEYLYITAAYDQKDIFYPEIRFTYDTIQDIICYVDISPDTKFARVAE